MGSRFLPGRATVVMVIVGLLVVSLLIPAAMVGAQGTPTAEEMPTGGTPDAGTPTATTAPEAVDLDVLFIGAHPDDEAFALSAYGQWNEDAGLQVGVITITRGEGGGNAVGTEEGPALGLLREGEERRAVGLAGIAHVYNLDKVDFYYNLSSPLTEEIWGEEETLEKVVRVVRATRPDVITTMDPSPNTHGHHQLAARLAIEAFAAAADPSVFPDQIGQEGYQPWRVKRIFIDGADVDGPSGPVCASTFVPAEPTDVVYGVWEGRESPRHDGRTWAAIARDAQREYASQGWAGFPDVLTAPTQLSCVYFTLVDSRVPFTLGNTGPTAMLEGALEPGPGGLPLGTEFYLTTDGFDFTPGQVITVTAHARAADGEELADAAVALSLPDGWSAEGDGVLGAPGPEGEATATFAVSVPPDAAVNSRSRMVGTLTAGGAQGTTDEVVRVVPAVRGMIEPLPQVTQFREWAAEHGVLQLDALIEPRLSLATGETREVRVDLVNNGSEPQSGSVDLTLPAGFSADAASQPFDGLAPGAAESVTFQVTNTDTSLPTANEGGDYPVTVTTSVEGGAIGTERGVLNLVPTTTVPQADTAPTVDGTEAAGEYAGETLDLSRLWEGDDPESPADASGAAKIVWSGDDLYLLVTVTDDTLGTVLPANDAKRHWRTDSVEITIDPRGDSQHTATTFKVGVFPTTAETGEPAAYRDADAQQGDVGDTAPGFEVASAVSDPYAGYTLEVRIPLASLPAAIDPARMTVNVFIYDSDTQDKTGQTRLGWSTFNGVQADPNRWGRALMEDYTPPADRPTEPGEPVLPLTPTRSVESPQSILQSAMDGVPLAGGRAAPADSITIASDPTVTADGVSVDLQAASAGTAHVFVWDGTQLVSEQTVEMTAGQTQTVVLAPDGTGTGVMVPSESGSLLVSFETADGGTASLAVPITG